VLDELSIPNLLSLLQVDRSSAMMKLCIEAEGLRRQRCYKDAIDLAQSAVKLAQYDSALVGVSLLYSSCARATSSQPHEEEIAVHECNRAIRALNLFPYNLAIAQIVRAQIELWCDTADCQESALVFFDHARKILQTLMTEGQKYGYLEQAERCQNLYARVTEKGVEVAEALARRVVVRATSTLRAAPPTLTSTPQAAPPPQTSDTPSEFSRGAKPPIKLPIPTRLVWPLPEPKIGLELLPLATGTAPDFVEVNQVSINHQLYKVEPVEYAVSSGGLVPIRTRQPYLVVPLKDDANGRCALVRQEARLDQPRRYIAIDDPVKRETWIDESESTSPYNRIHIIGAERDWVIHDETELVPYNVHELHIIGSVEAILTPAKASIPST
jgi:hypothetical protein